MRKFEKGSVVTVVDDDDKRISEYLSKGWKEVSSSKKTTDEIDTRIARALKEISESESAKGQKKRRTPVFDKKANDAFSAAHVAELESEVIDDGILKK